jgi:hypothetical protein
MRWPIGSEELWGLWEESNLLGDFPGHDGVTKEYFIDFSDYTKQVKLDEWN